MRAGDFYDSLNGQRAGVAVAGGEIMDAGGVRIHRGFQLLGGRPVLIAYLDQLAAGDGHAAVVLDAQLALDDEFVGHPGRIGDALYLVGVVAGHAGGGGEGEGGGATGCDQRRLDAEHVRHPLAHRVHQLAHVDIRGFGGVHHRPRFGGRRAAAQQRPVALRVYDGLDAQFFVDARHRGSSPPYMQRAISSCGGLSPGR